MDTTHLILGAILAGEFVGICWIVWVARQIYHTQVIEVLQGRSIKDVVDELHRMLLERGRAR
jgi:hypothetical protein